MTDSLLSLVLLQKTGAIFFCIQVHRSCSSMDSGHIFSKKSLEEVLLFKPSTEVVSKSQSYRLLFNSLNMSQTDNFLPNTLLNVMSDNESRR